MADNQVAFPALIDRLTVKMSYGDKEATLTLKFRPEGSSVDDLNKLMGNDQAVMVGIVPIDNTGKNYAVSERTRSKRGKTQGSEV